MQEVASRKSLKAVLTHPRYIGNVSTSSLSKENIPYCVNCAEFIWKNLTRTQLQSTVYPSFSPQRKQLSSGFQVFGDLGKATTFQVTKMCDPSL